MLGRPDEVRRRVSKGEGEGGREGGSRDVKEGGPVGMSRR